MTAGERTRWAVSALLAMLVFIAFLGQRLDRRFELHRDIEAHDGMFLLACEQLAARQTTPDGEIGAWFAAECKAPSTARRLEEWREYVRGSGWTNVGGTKTRTATDP